jgi:hypothetical protein
MSALYCSTGSSQGAFSLPRGHEQIFICTQQISLVHIFFLQAAQVLQQGSNLGANRAK